jgi:hypothetical protein
MGKSQASDRQCAPAANAPAAAGAPACGARMRARRNVLGCSHLCRGLGRRRGLLQIGKLRLELIQLCSALRRLSCRSFLIVSLSFSTSNIRGFASGGRAGCSLSAQHRLQCRHVIGGENHRRPSPTGEAPYAVSVRTAGVVSIQITAIGRPPAVATCVAASASQCPQASSQAGAV